MNIFRSKFSVKRWIDSDECAERKKFGFLDLSGDGIGSRPHKCFLFCRLPAVIFLVTMISVSLLAGINEWTSLRGPGGANIASMAAVSDDPVVIYAAINREGLMKSIDCGDTWTLINGEDLVKNIYALSLDSGNPDILYALTWTDPKSIYKSEDGGEIWAVLYDASSFNFFSFQSLAVATGNPNIIYAGTNAGDIFKSSNGGIDWVQYTIQIFGVIPWISVLAIDSDNANVVYAGATRGGVLKTEDGGESWSEVLHLDNRHNVISMVFSPDNPSTVFVGVSKSFPNEGGFIYRTHDGGVTWESSTFDQSIDSLALGSGRSEIIYAGFKGVNLLRKSVDSGNTWICLEGPYDSLGFGGINQIVIIPGSPQTLLVSPYEITPDKYSIFKTIDDGDNWTEISAGLYNTDVRCMVGHPVDGRYFYAGTYGSGVFQGAGSGWYFISLATIIGDLPDASVLSLATTLAEPRVLLAGTRESGVFKRFYSSSYGYRWTSLNGDGLTHNTILSLAVDPENLEIIYAGTDGGGVFRTTDEGENWAASESGLSNQVVQSIAIAPDVQDTLYAGTAEGIFMSANGAQDWTKLDDLPDVSVRRIVVDPVTPETLFAATDNGIYKSHDHGAHWEATSEGLSHLDVRTLVMHPLEPSILFAGTFGVGVFQSVDGGDSWMPLNDGLSNLDIRSIDFIMDAPFTVCAGTAGSGVVCFTPDLAGDVNRDGLVNAMDLALLADILVENVVLPSTTVIHTDINGDGKLTVEDLAILHHYFVGNI